jgi:hypothetical protein
VFSIGVFKLSEWLLTRLVNLVQGYIVLSTKMLVFFFIFSFGFAIVGNNSYNGDYGHVLTIN